MRAFEIHTYRGGKWKIDSVFDDRDLALFEAGRMETSSRFAGVRVIEENFNEDTQEVTTKTIYRGRKTEQPKSAPRQKSGARTGPDGKPQSVGKAPTGKKGSKKEEKKKSFGSTMLILVLSVLGGIAAIVALRLLADLI